MHPYRTHSCADLRPEQVGQTVRLSGWINRKREHAGPLFIDLRDHHGITQCVILESNPAYEALRRARVETVVTLTGELKARAADAVNAKLPTGAVELYVDDVVIQSSAAPLPLQVNSDDDAPISGCNADLRPRRVKGNCRIHGCLPFELMMP